MGHMCVMTPSRPLSPVAYIGFEQPTYTVHEGNGSVRVCVDVLRGELGYPINFRVSVGDATAEGTIGLLYVTQLWLPCSSLHQSR